MIHMKTICTLLSLALCPPVIAQEFISLQQCRQMALSYSQDLKAARHEISAREALHRSARADFYPQISADGNASFTGNPTELTWTRDGEPQTLRGKHSQYGLGIQMELPLYQGGGLQARLRKARQEAEQARLAAAQTGSEIILEADRRYWTLVVRQELLQVSRQYYHTADSLMRTIEERVREELTDRSDLLMAQVKRNDAAYQLREAQRCWEVSRLSLASFLGISDPAALQTDSVVAPLYLAGTSSVPADSLLSRRPEYAIATRQIGIQEHTARINKAQYLPSLSVGASGQLSSPGYNFRPDTDPNYQLYAKLTVPVFEWGKRRHQHTADLSRTAMAREEADKTRDRILLEIHTTASNQEAAAEQVVLTESSLHKARENSLLALDQYREGLVSITEVLDAQIYYLEAHRNFVTSKYNAQIARSEYLKACGSLTM